MTSVKDNLGIEEMLTASATLAATTATHTPRVVGGWRVEVQSVVQTVAATDRRGTDSSSILCDWQVYRQQQWTEWPAGVHIEAVNCVQLVAVNYVTVRRGTYNSSTLCDRQIMLRNVGHSKFQQIPLPIEIYKISSFIKGCIKGCGCVCI